MLCVFGIIKGDHRSRKQLNAGNSLLLPARVWSRLQQALESIFSPLPGAFEWITSRRLKLVREACVSLKGLSPFNTKVQVAPSIFTYGRLAAEFLHQPYKHFLCLEREALIPLDCGYCVGNNAVLAGHKVVSTYP